MGIERASTEFLRERLDLASHEENYVIIRASYGLDFLGMRIYPAGRTPNKRNSSQIKNGLSIRNPELQLPLEAVSEGETYQSIPVGYGGKIGKC